MELSDIESQIEAYIKSVTIVGYADEKTAEIFNIKVGDSYSYVPKPQNKQESFERLEKYSGLLQLKKCINTFYQKSSKNKRTLEDQLKKINDFIAKADEINTDDASNNLNPNQGENRLYYEYLKWKFDYYKNENIEFTSNPSFISADLMLVYGKYFLYKKWLEEQIIKVTPKSNTQLSFPKSHQEFKITIFEKIKRELNAIQWIFTSQFLSKSIDFSSPIIHQDGRYCTFINIRSNQKLNNIEKYKLHYTKRFEGAKDNVVVKNELIEIYNKAFFIRNYFNENLTKKNKIVRDYYELFSEDSLPDLDIINAHSMRIVVDYYIPQNILFGIDVLTNDYQNKWTQREFSYDVSNKQLVEFCQNLIEFIDKFKIPALKSHEEEVIGVVKDDLEFNVITRAEQPKMFENNIPKTNKDKKIAHPTHNPNLWNVNCYDLFKYLFDNYYSNTKRQLTNIWFFLKENRNEKYNFYATKHNYKSFIFAEYNIKITNVDKAENKWEEKDLPKLKEHLANFEEHVKNT